MSETITPSSSAAVAPALARPRFTEPAPVGVLKSLLDHLADQQALVPLERRGLGSELADLRARLGTDPAREADPRFRTEVAWLLKDWKQHSGTGQQPWLPPDMTAEMGRLSVEVPGLRSADMKSLLAQTGENQDRALVKELRAEALRMSALSPEEQAAEAVVKLIGVLEWRFGAARAVPEAVPTPVPEAVSEPETAKSVAPEPETQLNNPVPLRDTVPEPMVQEPDVRDTAPFAAHPVEDHGREAMTEPPGAGVLEAVTPDRPADHEPPTDAPVVLLERGDRAEAPSETEVAEGNQQPEEDPGYRAALDADVARHDGRALPGSGEQPEASSRPQQSSDRQSGSQGASIPDSEQTDLRQRQADAQAARDAETQSPESGGRASTPKPQPDEKTTSQRGPSKPSSKQATPPTGTTQTFNVRPSPFAPVDASREPKAGVGLAAFVERFTAKTDETRLFKLGEKAEGHLRQAETELSNLRQHGRAFFAEFDKAVQEDRTTPAAVIAGMTDSGPYARLRNSFDSQLANNPPFRQAYEGVGMAMSKTRNRWAQLGNEARERGATDNPNLQRLEQGIAKMAPELAKVPGKEPGKSLLQEVGAFVERIVENVKRFAERVTGRAPDRARDDSPSPGR